ncbi:MAG TPA: excinuclease ABC subunit UvrA, partial [Verrucomicrobiae bacterium]
MTQRPPVPAIRLRGVRHHNLKNFDLDLPLGQLIVITGLSGSGKSSLAFDTLFAEGQRRYIETFSPYARQFFDRMDKPQVDRIDGIPPAIAIEQRNSVKSTRSTVGTMTELCDYMKLLWPHLAQLRCRQCGRPVRKESPQFIWETIHSNAETRNSELLITFDLPLSEKLPLAESLALIRKQGYQRLLFGSEIVRIDEAEARITPHASRITSLTPIQDCLKLTPANRPRFIEACEHAYHFGKGKLAVHRINPSPFTLHPSQPFSSGSHCARCDLDYREPTPALFSFNHPVGACPACKGFGRIISIDYGLAVPDRRKTLAQGVVKPWQTGQGAECQDDLMKFCHAAKIPTHIPFEKLPQKFQDWVINGDPDYGTDEEHEWPRAWYGVKGYFRWLEARAYKMHVRVLLSRYRAYSTCPDCRGKRFQPESLLYRLTIDDLRFTSAASHSPAARKSEIGNRNSSITLADFYQLPIDAALNLIDSLASSRPFKSTDPIALVLNEVRARLGYLVQVGLGYLALDRPTRTLSGGETERVNLTTCLGTRLVNTLFVLDEPSVGLHPHDTARLVRILQTLRDTGNTVVVVEHEAGVIRAADQIVDLGPGQGEAGGQIVFQGPFRALLKSKHSVTGQYLSGAKRIEMPPRRPVKVEQVSNVFSARTGLPLPVRNERGEGRGEGHPTADTPAHLQARRPSSPQLSPPSAGREGEETGALNTYRASRLSRPSNDTPFSAGTFALNEAVPPYGDRRDACPTLKITHADHHNLKNLTVEIPLQRFVCLTGVSGSGKTTLVREVLLPALEAELRKAEDRRQKAKGREQKAEVRGQKAEETADATDTSLTSDLRPLTSGLTGHNHLARAVLVDQSPLGKTPRSNPVVYIGAFDDIRDLFAQTDLARQRGLNSSAFSFNSGQGQCARCRGAGFEKIEMQFLSDVFIRCPDCQGRRYRSHILEVKLKGSRCPGSEAVISRSVISKSVIRHRPARNSSRTKRSGGSLNTDSLITE